MKTLSITIAVFAVLVGVSCSDSETGYDTTAQQNAQVDAQRLLLAQTIPNLQGAQTTYYRGDLYRIDMMRISKATTISVLESGQHISKIFYTVNYPYKLVLNTATNQRITQYALLCAIEFNVNVRPRQLHSMAEIEEALAAGEIKVSGTDVFYSFGFI